MFDKIAYHSSSTNVNVDMSGVENKLESIDNTLEKFIEISKDGFVRVGDSNFRISSIVGITHIFDNKFIVTAGSDKIEVSDEDEFVVYNAYRVITNELGIEFKLKDYMRECPDCSLIHNTKDISEEFLWTHPSKSNFCPDCRKRYMNPLEVFRGYEYMDIRVIWPDGQRDIILDSFEASELLEKWRKYNG